ncbi:MAG: NifU family protein [Phycisphaerales bacterium]|jgi:Fe-S cluster biogenesis protein NfuA
MSVPTPKTDLAPSPTGPDPESVATVIASIRPAVQADGGDIELAGIRTGGIVAIRFLGACVGCPSAGVTLQQFIERALVEVPGVHGVIAVP